MANWFNRLFGGGGGEVPKEPPKEEKPPETPPAIPSASAEKPSVKKIVEDGKKPEETGELRIGINNYPIARGLLLLGGLAIGAAEATVNYQKNVETDTPPPTPTLKELAESSGEAEAVIEPKFLAYNLAQPESRAKFFEDVENGKVGVEIYPEIVRTDEEGNAYINWTGIISPMGIALSQIVPHDELVRVRVPQEYAILFNSGKALRPEDQQKARDYIAQALIKELIAQHVSGLDAREVYLHEDAQKLELLSPNEREGLKIKSVKLVGQASPEGHEAHGPKTLIPGNIDKENISLAQLRADNMKQTVVDAIKQALSGKEVVGDEWMQNIQTEAEELQNPPQEWKQLDELAKKLGFEQSTPESRIYSMVIDFNDGEIEDPEAQKALNDLIAAKRAVVLTVEYENNRKETFLVPIPWLVLLALVPWVSRRKKSPESPAPTEPVKPVEPVSDVPKDFTIEPGIPDNLDSKTAMRFTVENNLLVNWNNEDVKKRGIDYEALAKEAEATYDTLQSEDERQKVLAYKILQAWTAHDKVKIAEAGLNPEDFEDHAKNPTQRQWARMHAISILDAVRMKRDYDAKRAQDASLKKKSYQDFLEEIAAQLG